MFHHLSSSSLTSLEKEDRRSEDSGDRIAVEISKENEAHMAENRILKEQNQVIFLRSPYWNLHDRSSSSYSLLRLQLQIDENVRNNLEKQVMDHHLANDVIVESEKSTRQMEYRQFLLKQIEDKEKEKKERNASEIRGNSYVYSEELLAPEMYVLQNLTIISIRNIFVR